MLSTYLGGEDFWPLGFSDDDPDMIGSLPEAGVVGDVCAPGASHRGLDIYTTKTKMHYKIGHLMTCMYKKNA